MAGNTFLRDDLAAIGLTERKLRLLRAASRASLNNPRINGLYAGTATVTANDATIPAATPQAFLMSPTNRGVWKVVGGTPVNASVKTLMVSSVIAATGGTVGTNDGRNATTFRASARCDSQYFAARLGSTTLPYRFLVNDQYISLAGTAVTTTGGSVVQYILIDFGSRAERKITVEGQLGSSFQGGYVEATGAMYPIDTSDVPEIAFLGDSYVQGTGPSNYADGVAMVMGDWMGANVLCSGSPGTTWGRTSGTSPVAYAFETRIANGDLGLGGVTPDLICLMASINGQTDAASVITAGATAGLQSARAQYPGVPIIVFGCLAGATGPSTGATSVTNSETAVQAAVAALADPLVSFVPVSTDLNGAWVKGTGKIGTTTGTGNSDWATNADGIHPSPEGAPMIGRRYALSALAAIKALAA